MAESILAREASGMVGGHNNQSTESLNIMLEMTKVSVQNREI